jgi:hypothetical protein
VRLARSLRSSGAAFGSRPGRHIRDSASIPSTGSWAVAPRGGRLRGACGGGVALVPPPQRLEREDAGVVAVVPRDVEAPSAVKAGVVDAQRRRAAGTGPDDLVSVAKTPACGARTTQAECHQVEAGDVPVEERDRDAVISLDNGVRRPESIVHRHSLPPVRQPWQGCEPPWTCRRGRATVASHQGGSRSCCHRRRDEDQVVSHEGKR